MIEHGGRSYMTPEEAALVLDVTPGHVRWLLRMGRIEGWQDRRRRWALADAVRKYGVVHGTLVVGRNLARAKGGSRG